MLFNRFLRFVVRFKRGNEGNLIHNRNFMQTSVNKPPAGVHVPGTVRGEEKALKDREPGRNPHRKYYRSARDATGINAAKRAPIDRRMPQMPPP